jgi:hypothetical protein
MPRPPLPAPSLDAAWIEQRIYVVRGVKVMLDTDLAALFGVLTKRLNEQARRNRRRFPGDFLFELTPEEVASLRSQIATSNARVGRGGTFVRLRHALQGHAELAKKVEELEQRYDGQFQVVFDALRELTRLPEGPPRPRVGFSDTET